MAKKIDYSRPSADLIKGAAAVYGSQNLSGGIEIPGASSLSSNVGARMAQKKQAANNRVARYMDQVPGDDFSFSNVPQNQVEKVQNYIQEQRKIYADNAITLGQFDPDTPAYAEAMSAMSNAKNNIATLKEDLTKFNDNKTSYLEDANSGLVSQAVNPDDYDALSKIYTDETEWNIQGGRIFADVKGEQKDISNWPSYFNRDVEIMNAMLPMSEDVFSNPDKLKGPSRDMYRMQIVNRLSKNPQESIQSMVADYGLEFDASQYGNDTQAMINGAADVWMQKLETVASQGAAAKAEEERKKALRRGKGDGQFTGWANYGGVPTHVASGLKFPEITNMGNAIAAGDFSKPFKFKGPTDTEAREYVLGDYTTKPGEPMEMYFVPKNEPATSGNIISLKTAYDYIPGLYDAAQKAVGAGKPVF